MIKFVSKDFKNIKIGSKQVVKVMQGIEVVWEKNVDSIMQITFESISDMSPYSRQIPLTKVLSDEIVGKEIVGVYIDGFKEITGEKAKIGNYDSIWLTNSLDELIGATDFIKKGTKIIIKYK